MLAPLLGHPLRGLLPSVVGGYHEKWPIRASLRHPASARFAIRPTASGDMLAIYIYVFGSQSCATRLIFVGSARLRPETKPRMAPLVEFVARMSALGLATVPRGNAPAPFARHPRRDAASPEYRLLASLAPVGAIREPHPRVSLRSALGHSPRFLTTC